MAKAMVVAGVMSGTSADGVDVAVCRIGPGRTESDSPKLKLLGYVGKAYPKGLRTEVMRVMEGGVLTAAEMSRLNWRLGAIYADCVARAAKKLGVKLGLAGLHGQTIHHAAGSTWQMGEAAVVAERMRCPVVSDFRPADVAAGGQGAPLVPMLDWCLFRSAKVNRVLQNLGGIGNLTALPVGCGVQEVMAFDTGPGNMVIDACMAKLFGKKYDRSGATAQRGRVLSGVVDSLMRGGYFSASPPKSCGREEFGAAYAERLIAMCRSEGGSDNDCVATATGLTAASVVDAYRRFVWAAPNFQSRYMGLPVEFCVAGGGAKNGMLMGMFREGFAEFGVRVRMSDELGVPAQAKEGMAFALLAWLTWHGMTGNVPAATGAKRAVALGKVSYG